MSDEQDRQNRRQLDAESIRRHVHVSTTFPPDRCDVCGELWRHVLDGRAGRARRRRQLRLEL